MGKNVNNNYDASYDYHLQECLLLPLFDSANTFKIPCQGCLPLSYPDAKHKHKTYSKLSQRLVRFAA